jgi:hypothetical protein
MRLLFNRLWLLAGASAVLSGCGGSDGLSPSTQPPASIVPVSDLNRTSAVGSPVGSGIVVRVSDAAGRPVQGANVAFAVTLGNGSTNPRIAVTDASGQATTAWTLGTVLGPNEVTATVAGVTTQIKFEATGVAGSVSTIVLSSRSVRLLTNIDTARISASAVDAFGNQTAPPPTFLARDPTLVSVDQSGAIRALRRGSSTYVVAAAGGKSDSALVTVLAAGQSICTAVATPTEVAIGQVITGLPGTGVCVHASAANAEYAIVPFYDSAVPSATIQVEVRPLGVSPIPLTTSALASRAPAVFMPAAGLVPDDDAESRFRDRERAQFTAHIAASGGSLLSARRDLVPGKAQTTAIPAVGDIIKFNANAVDYCTNPDMRAARVMAVTDRAIVVADTNNPAGGFTADEYRSIGVTFDTLVDPTDRAAFGSPSDIDGNGHVILFFTRAVNELTSQGSGSVFLGFFYSRDLFPKTGTSACDGSNVAEMFYLLVPDSTGVVNGNVRTKSQVLTFTNGTVAHEYQHLINASRRMYVNATNLSATLEEKWLDEGLAHIAEDLNFWPSSGRTPRSNIDNKIFSDPRAVAAYSTFAVNNQKRYATYLGATEIQSPIGSSAFDDDLQTRGAIWSFLRYAADHLTIPENTFWFNLVNSKTTGVANLTNAIGAAPDAMLRDWAISVFMDDNAAGVDARFQQPSWNMRSLITNGGTSVAFPLATRQLSDNVTNTLTLGADGVSFLRFSVPSGQDALLTVTSNGQPLPSTVQLAVVRIR